MSPTQRIMARALGVLIPALGVLALGQNQTLKPLAMPLVPSIAKSEKQILDGATERIEYFRKGYVRVIVKDANGKPIQNARVKLEQLKHQFLFGANLFGLDPEDASEAQLTYQKRFLEVFNFATLPFYWGGFERKRGEPEYDRLDAMVAWGLEHGLTLKGHPLVWQGVYPGWAPNDAATTELLLQARVTDLVGRYKGKIQYWDLVNEASSASQYDNGLGAWAKRDGAARIVSASLGWARAAGERKSRFVYNDYDTGQANTALLGQLAQAKDLPDAIGLQSHMLQEPWPIMQVWKVMATFAKFQKPIHFTEVGVLSGVPLESGKPAPKPWPSTPSGEAKQANYVTKFYTLLFSHPAVTAITWWDLPDKNSPSGWLRADMTAKPVFDRMRRLIREKWWTNKSGLTNVDGEFRVRAFLGSHRVSVLVNDEPREATLEVIRNGVAEARLEVKL